MKYIAAALALVLAGCASAPPPKPIIETRIQKVYVQTYKPLGRGLYTMPPFSTLNTNGDLLGDDLTCRGKLRGIGKLQPAPSRPRRKP